MDANFAIFAQKWTKGHKTDSIQWREDATLLAFFPTILQTGTRVSLATPIDVTDLQASRLQLPLARHQAYAGMLYECYMLVIWGVWDVCVAICVCVLVCVRFCWCACMCMCRFLCVGKVIGNKG